MKKIALLFSLFFATSSYAISLEDYARHAQLLNIKISPTGKYFAATNRTEDGTIQIVVLDRSTMAVVSQQHFRGKESIHDFHWAKDERLVLSVAREVGSLENPQPTGELFAMNADGKRRLMIAGYRAKFSSYESNEVIDWLPEDDDDILTVSYEWRAEEPAAKIYRLNIYSGRRNLVDKTPLRSSHDSPVRVVVDGKGVPRFAMGLDQKNPQQMVTLYRPTAESKWTELARHDLEKGSFIPLRFRAGEQEIIGLSNNTTDTDALTVLNLATKQQSILAKHPKTNVSPVYALKNGNTGEIIGATYEYKTVETVFFEDTEDQDFARSIEMLMPSFAGRTVQINSATRDNKLMVLSVSSVNAAPEFFLFDTVEKKVTYLFSSKAWLKPEELPQTQAIVYKSRDGVDIQALLTLPKGVPAENLPLIMLPHGGPHGIRDSLRSVDSDAKVLAEHGYAVLQPNFRGSGGFGLSFEQAGYRNWGLRMIDDMTDGVQHLIKTKLVDGNRVCSYGASYGGYAALMSAIREPDLYKCTVGFVGVYDLNLMFTKGDIADRDAGQLYLEKVLGKDPAQLNAQSPVHNLDKLKAPVFIIHGEEDKRVPLIQAERLREQLDKRQHPYQWLVKENEGHGFYKPENNVERWKLMLEFFDKHIGQNQS